MNDTATIAERLDAIDAKLGDMASTTGQAKWLTVSGASRRSSLSEKSIRRLLESGKLTAHRPIAGRVLIDTDELDGLIRGATQQTRKGRGKR